MSIQTEYAPEGSTRLGMAAPVFGEMAVGFGITIALLGSVPLRCSPLLTSFGN